MTLVSDKGINQLALTEVRGFLKTGMVIEVDDATPIPDISEWNKYGAKIVTNNFLIIMSKKENTTRKPMPGTFNYAAECCMWKNRSYTYTLKYDGVTRSEVEQFLTDNGIEWKTREFEKYGMGG